MPKLPRLSPSLALVLALTAALMAVLAAAAVLAHAFWNLHRNTAGLLGEHLEVGLALIGDGIEASAAPEALSRQLDRRAVRAGGVAFVLDAGDGLLAHPLIAAGLLNPGVPARQEDAILAAFVSPQARIAPLAVSGADAALVEVRGDHYGVAVRPRAGATGQRLGLYLLRPSALDLLSPADRVVMTLGGAGLAVLLAFWLYARARLKPLAAIVAAAEGMAGLEPTAVGAVADTGGPEMRRAAKAINRLREVVRIYDGLLPRSLARRLVNTPGVLKPRELEVVVLASGLAGFAELVRGLDATAATDLLRRHLTLVTGRVAANGGTPIEISGDTVLALWEPTADGPAVPDGALRAARAIAKLIDDENAARREAGRAPFRLCLAIAAGTALVGDIGPAGRITPTALGPPVSLARRLERACRALPDDGGAVRCLATAAASDGTDTSDPPELPDDLAPHAVRRLHL